MNNKIVLAIGDHYARRSLRNILQEMTLDIREVSSGPQAIKDVITLNPGIIIVDDTLPHINGYQFSRLLKHGLNLDIPLILFYTSQLKMDRFWGVSCGADYCLSIPVNVPELKQIINEIFTKKATAKSFFKSSIIGQHTSDSDILKMVNDLLDRDLFQQKLLNDLSAMHRQLTSLEDLATVMMSILSSLFPFRAAAFFICSETLVNFMVFINQEIKQQSLESLYGAIITHINKERKLHLTIKDIPITVLKSTISDSEKNRPETLENQDISIFSLDNSRNILCYIGFDGLNMDKFPKEEIRIFNIFIRRIMEAIEEKIVFAKSIHFSIINAVKAKDSHRSFFLDLLSRYMDQAHRYKAPLAIVVVDFPNYPQVLKSLDKKERFHFRQNIHQAILNNIRKIDIVARIDENRFAILFPNIGVEEAQIVYRQVKLVLDENSPRDIPLQIHEGFCQYTPIYGLNGEEFLEAAHAHITSQQTTDEQKKENLPAMIVAEAASEEEMPGTEATPSEVLREESPRKENLPAMIVAEAASEEEMPGTEATPSEVLREELPRKENLPDMIFAEAASEEGVPGIETSSNKVLREESPRKENLPDTIVAEAASSESKRDAEFVSNEIFKENNHVEESLSDTIPIDDISLEESLSDEIIAEDDPIEGISIEESFYNDVALEEDPLEESFNGESFIEGPSVEECFGEGADYEEPSIDEFIENPILMQDQFLGVEVDQKNE
ncbi:MAG: response regulator [bacterium]